ncbi:TylF/MycF family methyltransferase [Candidatus Chloroploca sp. Khr17]|uniref:TylF/MycF family methyltransferase n=1 Tax=Candidatus Chloroploca sp. Khr17 TaxID=2496869 RepID=UPI00196A35F7|nr:TylF/MycF family methyltransferase [Candidatus Chloroploca sp. Khr17]
MISPTDSLPTPSSDLRQMYLELLKRCLLGMIYEDAPTSAPAIGGYKTELYIAQFREMGRDIPSQAHSMIGLRRMNNLQACIEQVLADGVPGDLIETGVWRGGATILMRGVLKAYGVTDRTVWVADSFEGLPTPDVEQHPADTFWVSLALAGWLTVDLETVRRNFASYGLLDDHVRFLKGWFKDTLPDAPITRLAVLRLDGDLYESTWDALTHLYPKLSQGGFLIVDDYFYESCRQAVHDYRARHGIHEPIQDIDGLSVYWRKQNGG